MSAPPNTLLLIFLLFAAGCQPLPAGSLEAVGGASNSPRPGDVYLLRGWRDLYSGGIDQLATKLRDRGVRATVYREAQWRELADAITHKGGADNRREPLVLIGFSWGADDAVRIARELQSRHLQVDLLVTIDPVTPPPVPGNVRTCYNFYQSNGVWDLFPWLRGIPLQSGGAASLTNINIRHHPDLLEPNTSHATIAANPKLHRAIIDRVLSVCTLRATSPPAESSAP